MADALEAREWMQNLHSPRFHVRLSLRFGSRVYREHGAVSVKEHGFRH